MKIEEMRKNFTTENTEHTEGAPAAGGENAELPNKLILKRESFIIRGAIFEVYREMGCGFLEMVYQECLEKEFQRRDIPFKSQEDLILYYKDEQLSQTYKPDFICFDQIIVELKVVKNLLDIHRAQILNYLKGSNRVLGLLVNFGHFPNVEIERIVI